MAQQNFEQPLDGGNLRAQRMTADESRAVIDLWQQEQTELTGLTDKPAVPDVAEGLDITVEDVQRLLSEVRASEQKIIMAETQLAEEEAGLAEIRRQRIETRRFAMEAARQAVKTSQTQKASPNLRRVKPRQSAPIEWAGVEDFWQKTEEDLEAGRAYRAARATRAVVYTLLIFLFLLLLPSLYIFWVMLKQ